MTALLGDVLARVDEVTTGADGQPLLIAERVAVGPQVATFVIAVGGRQPFHRSVSGPDAEALLDLLIAERSPPAISLAVKLVDATQLPTPTTDVQVKIGEDDALLRALDQIREQGESLDQPLTALYTALRAKLDAEK
jgi:DNA-binding IclR family transcriptional regulator